MALKLEQESTASVQTTFEVRADEVRHEIDDAKDQIDTLASSISWLSLIHISEPTRPY